MKWLSIFILAITPFFAFSDDDAQLQIKKFRFNRHVKLGFERLVIEFSNKAPGKVVPNIRLIPDKLGKETTVQVSKATLVGAIPESSMNDSYAKKSHYFGPVSINTDTTAGFEIRTFIKQSHSIVDAFWLQNPSRLIVDVFPKDSERALGANIKTSRTTASFESSEPTASKVNSNGAKTNRSDWMKLEKPEDDLVLCFPTNTQVKANIGFEKFTPRLGAGVPLSIDNTFSSASSSVQESIVCYPKGAQVTPLLKFQPNQNSQYGRVELENGNAPNPMNGRQPSSIPQMNPNGNSQQFNGGYPQQFNGGYPQQFNGGYPQQFNRGYPQQSNRGYPQQFNGGYSGNNQYAPTQRMGPQSNFNSPRNNQMNQDADLAFGLQGDSKLSLKSFGNANGNRTYQDSFQQKAPPLSLGKKLPPPNAIN